MQTKMMKKSLGLFMFSGFILLASVTEAYSQFYTLTVKVLDAKKTYCTGSPTLIRSATVSIRFSSGVMNATTNADGVAVFTSVPGGTNYGITASRTGCDRKTVPYSMPRQNAETTIGLENCGTGLNYDILARFLGTGIDAVAVGNSYTVSFVVKNNGANGPSRARNVTLVRYFGDAEGSRVVVGSPKRVPSLCVNEETGFDVTDTQLSVGGWIYTLQWESSPDQGITNTNHLPTKTVTVRSR